MVVHSVLLPVGSQRPSEPLLKARKLPTGPAGPETTCDQVRPPSVERSSRGWLATLTCTTSDEDDTAICRPRTPAGRVPATPYVAPKSCDTRTVTGPPERRAWQSTANEPGGPMAADTASPDRSSRVRSPLSAGVLTPAHVPVRVSARCTEKVQPGGQPGWSVTTRRRSPPLGLRVYPPGSRLTMYVPNPHPACTSPTAHLLDVGPLRAS